MKKTKLGLLALAITAISAPAFAATANGDLQVSANATAGCSITALPIEFGTATNGEEIKKNSTLTLSCSKGVSYAIALNAGLHSSGGGVSPPRNLKGVTEGNDDLLLYTVTRDADFTQIWSQTALRFVQGVGSGAAQEITMYAKLFSTGANYVKADSYSDTLTLTVNY